MLRVVVDTSCLVSYVLTRGKLLSQVITGWREGTFAVLSSPATRVELAGVLARPSIRRLAVGPLDELVVGLTRFTEHVPGKLEIAGACRDPKDDKFIACAVEGRVHYVITGDRDLLVLRTYREVAIVNPGQFLVALELSQMDAETLAGRFSRETIEEIVQTIPLEPGTAACATQALGLHDRSAARSGDRPKQA
jgi:putative PIN family toxin of toxin-antitoxin system